MKDATLTESSRRTVRVAVFMWPRMGSWIWLALLLAARVPAPGAEEAAIPPESVKAAFLFRFGEYVEWPLVSPPSGAQSSGPFIIAVLGEPAVAAELRRILPGRTLQGRNVVVHELTQVKDLENSGGAEADILYLGTETKGALDHAIATAIQIHTPLLVVSNAAEGLAAGAAINFVTRDSRIRFEVSLAAARTANVKLSSRLFGVAVRVVSSAQN
jgi:hypothetical protein